MNRLLTTKVWPGTAGLVVFALSLSCYGQRIQFPNTTIPADPYATSPPTTYGSGPFPSTTIPAPSIPASPPSTYGAPTMGGIGSPTFDPYGGTGGWQPPPTPAPYTYSPGDLPQPTLPGSSTPYAGSTIPTTPGQSGGLYPEGLPFEWQPGTYDYQGAANPFAGGEPLSLVRNFGFEYTWIHGDHTDPEDFEISRAEFFSTFTLPLFQNFETPLLLTPGFAANFLEGPLADPAAMPRGADMPPRMYDAYLDVAWYPQFSQWFGAELGARVGVWTDFDHTTSDSVRLLGRGLGKITVSPQLDILLGVVYLDRIRVKLLPAGGIYWHPDDEWDAYIVFPNPKIRRRMSDLGNTKWYLFVAGEYGGGSWTVDRAGLSDRVDINDIRVSLGVEWETITQTRGHIEVGYVWDREILFGDSLMPARFKLDDSFMLRGGLNF